MVHIICKRGLDIPLKGTFSTKIVESSLPKTVALDCNFFSRTCRIKPLKKEGETIALAEPIAMDAHRHSRVFLSPAGGKVLEVKRGEKRRIISIVIELPEGQEPEHSFSPLSPDSNREEILQALSARGCLWHILERPFNRPASEEKPPKNIFISAIESAPFSPSPHLEVEKNQELFQFGLSLLSRLAPVHLVQNHDLFTSFKEVNIHRAEGPHPSGSFSLHIASIAPITSVSDTTWTLRPFDVLCIASLCKDGRFFKKQIVALAGEPIPEEKRNLYWTRRGASCESLFAPKESEKTRIISGDPLAGECCHGHLGFFHRTLTALSDKPKAGFLRFLGITSKHFTATRTYASLRKRYSFDTGLSGEFRPIVDKNIYERVMPLKIPVEPFIKALLAKDFDQALAYGLLEVCPEDFALAEFVCPSKTPFTKIVFDSINEYVSLYL